MNLLLISLLIVMPEIALAHAPEGAGGGFVTGFLHPIMGVDHLVAMVAVGLWGAFLGERALWILPIVFPSIMAVGAAFGIVGLEIPEFGTCLRSSSRMRRMPCKVSPAGSCRWPVLLVPIISTTNSGEMPAISPFRRRQRTFSVRSAL